jgi:chromosome segregation ATPase
MLAQNNRRGAAAGIVVAVIFLLLIAGGIWYFVSKPFQTHVNQAITQATDWTPENIKKDPAGYLTWAIAQTDGTKQKLDAAQLALTTQRNTIANKLEKASTDKSDYERLLKEMKAAYEKADNENSWPATVRRHEFDKNELKRKIVECDHNLQKATTLAGSCSDAKSKVAARLDEINDQLSKVDTLRTDLETKLETAKVQQTFEGIDNVSTNFDQIVSTSKALSETAEKSTGVNDLIKPTGDDRDNEEFDKIMGKKKEAPPAKDAPAPPKDAPAGK